MSSAPSSKLPADLLDRARDGDQLAWQLLFDECYPKVVRVIRHRMSRRGRNYYDSTDIANDVMKSLAAKFNGFDFSSIRGLQGFLFHAAEQKVVDRIRRDHAQKRDVSRVQPLDPGEPQARIEPPDHGPTPSQIVVARDEERLLLDKQSGEDRKVLELKLEGSDNAEVARETGWHIRKVERFLEKLRKQRRN